MRLAVAYHLAQVEIGFVMAVSGSDAVVTLHFRVTARVFFFNLVFTQPTGIAVQHIRLRVQLRQVVFFIGAGECKLRFHIIQVRHAAIHLPDSRRPRCWMTAYQQQCKQNRATSAPYLHLLRSLG
ncbi:hypothetical protein UF16_20755 [Chromobacterium violaceum]|nr:hypothetical protein UF16_20755 [Chromobacterium violaceum]